MIAFKPENTDSDDILLHRKRDKTFALLLGPLHPRRCRYGAWRAGWGAVAAVLFESPGVVVEGGGGRGSVTP